MDYDLDVLTTAECLLTASMRLFGCRTRLLDTPVGRISAMELRGRGPLPPIVLVHGLSARGADFAPLLPFLMRHERIIAPDLFGHGGSDAIPDLPPEQIHDAFNAAIATLCDKPAVVFGNSLGGLLAVKYATAHPDRVARLILASPGGASLDEPAREDLKSRLSLESPADARRFMDSVLARPGLKSRLFAWGARLRFNSPGVRDLLRRVAEGDGELAADEVRGLSMPTLVLWGKKDRLLPEPARRFFRDNLPADGTFEEPEDYGHAPFLDDPRGLGRRIATFSG